MEQKRAKFVLKEGIIYKIYSYFDVYDLVRFGRISKKWRNFLYEIPMPIFENLNLDLTQGLSPYNRKRMKKFLLDQNPEMKEIINRYDDNNEAIEDEFELGPKWRKVQLHLLSQQIYEQVHFCAEIMTKIQVIKSIKINFNNDDLCDDENNFTTTLKCVKYFLTSISKFCKTVERFEVIFLRSNRIERNEQYAEEIKNFLQAISDQETLKESMKVVKFDSYGTEIMVGLISGFKNLEELKIVDCIYLEGDYFPIIKATCLQKLNLSGSHQIESSHIQMLVERNSQTLRSLKLDGENIDGEELTQIIAELKTLEELCIYYGNSASSDLLKVIAKHSQTLKKLVIRKNENFLEQDLVFFFGHKFPKLHTLILDECNNLDTEGVKKIATNCLALRYYSSEWCLKIDPCAIENLILNCESLENLSLSGMKTLDDTVFSKLFAHVKDGKGIVPLKLKEINFKMCNYLSKPVLEQMKEYYPNCTVIDYYGEPVECDDNEASNNSSF
ncbi:unnamed protein product [Moneuplotes crassus]|uniref:F-box domain-containing protein n=1 Tax=Euplotes crassus TaxID=5936 RepID=A0AAD1UFS5_EUPCR|nr:unnamed protein product [Moneuplotes crassus]